MQRSGSRSQRPGGEVGNRSCGGPWIVAEHNLRGDPQPRCSHHRFGLFQHRPTVRECRSATELGEALYNNGVSTIQMFWSSQKQRKFRHRRKISKVTPGVDELLPGAAEMAVQQPLQVGQQLVLQVRSLHLPILHAAPPGDGVGQMMLLETAANALPESDAGDVSVYGTSDIRPAGSNRAASTRTPMVCTTPAANGRPSHLCKMGRTSAPAGRSNSPSSHGNAPAGSLRSAQTSRPCRQSATKSWPELRKPRGLLPVLPGQHPRRPSRTRPKSAQRPRSLMAHQGGARGRRLPPCAYERPRTPPPSGPASSARTPAAAATAQRANAESGRRRENRPHRTVHTHGQLTLPLSPESSSP